MKILIVDDSKDFRKQFKKMLREISKNITIYQADDANAAWIQINENIPDYIILDINMPKQNGIELLRDIKQKKNDSKIAMLTNFANDSFKQKSADLGADYFFDKSFQLPDLLEITSIIQNQLKNSFNN